jgi:hypothetical protein
MADSQLRRRRTIGKGIYADRWGLSGMVRVHGLAREKRFWNGPAPGDWEEEA